MEKHYNDFKELLAFYGFIDTAIISFSQYKLAVDMGLKDSQLYSIACDMNSGYSFEECL